MASLCLYFKVHQSYRLGLPGESTVDKDYRNRDAERQAIDHAADCCYLPANAIIRQLIEEHGDRFRISFSISGIMIELLQQYRPDVMESFRRLVDTGCMEILGETYYHSLASLHSIDEWTNQVNMHADIVEKVFGERPSVYRNTELIYHNNFANTISSLGLKGILCEGVDRILAGRNGNHVYQSPDGFPLLLRNSRLSDDIAFRFDDHSWSEHPLTADKFAEWLHSHPKETDVINLFMDYETFGLHKQADTGILEFLRALPAEVLKTGNIEFALPSEVLDRYAPVAVYDVQQTISWEDRGNAACVWSENMMQHNMLRKIYGIEKMVWSANCTRTIESWRQLQAADHFYYMTADNEKYRNPYTSKQVAFEQYSNTIADFEVAVINKNLEQIKKTTRLRTAALGILY